MSICTSCKSTAATPEAISHDTYCPGRVFAHWVETHLPDSALDPAPEGWEDYELVNAAQVPAQDDSTPLDVWFVMPDDDDEDESATHEANTFTDGDGYRIEWYGTGVGLVHYEYVDTLAAAHAWYAANGYRDFSS